MVLLTMTPPIVEALQRGDGVASPHNPAVEGQPSLEKPAVGQPISHDQIVELWKHSRHGETKCTLESLLVGSSVYIPPPPPKPEPTEEYKALMARLRRDEEERKYQRMVSTSNYQATAMPSFSQQFSTSSLAHSFAEVHRPSNKADEGDDDVTYNDVHRQVMLLINFLVTILGCAATLWILARWWNTPARLFLTMGGTLVVGIAEVGVYQAYIWHLSDAKRKEGKLKEVKEVVDTWVVGREAEAVEVDGKRPEGDEVGDKGEDGTQLRLRKGTTRQQT